MAPSLAVPGAVMAPGARGCGLPGCTRRAARGREYCSVAHLLAAEFEEGSA